MSIIIKDSQSTFLSKEEEEEEEGDKEEEEEEEEDVLGLLRDGCEVFFLFHDELKEKKRKIK